MRASTNRSASTSRTSGSRCTAAPRPRAEWPVVDGRLQTGADPIGFDDLASAFRPLQEQPGIGAGLSPGTTIGHVHLHVSRLDAAHRFHVDVLGFELMQRYGPSALFVSAGGYTIASA